MPQWTEGKPDSPGLLETWEKLRGARGGRVTELDCILAAKALASSYCERPDVAANLLEHVGNSDSDALSRKIHGRPVGDAILEQILGLSEAQNLRHSLVIFFRAAQQTPVQEPDLNTYIDKVFLNMSQPGNPMVNAELQALFTVPLTRWQLGTACRLTHLEQLNVETALAGLHKGEMWIDVCVDWIETADYSRIDDRCQAYLILKLVDSIASNRLFLARQRLIKLRLANINFNGCSLTEAVLSMAIKVLGAAETEEALQISPQRATMAYWKDTSEYLKHEIEDLEDQLGPLYENNPVCRSQLTPPYFNDYLVSLPNTLLELAPRFQISSETDKRKILTAIGKYLKVLVDEATVNIGKRPLLDANRDTLPSEWSLFFTSVIECQELLSNTDLRKLACSALVLSLNIWAPSFPLNHDTMLGSWLIGCLKSSSRHLRLIATQSIACFVSSQNFESEKSAMFKLAGTLHLSTTRETSLHALAEAAIVSQGEYLNFLLLRLTESLGSENQSLATFALFEFRRIAETKSQSTWQLCSPFWSTLSICVVKKVDSDAALLNRVCFLLEISPNDFLIRTAAFTVPYLILGRKMEIVSLVAAAKASNIKKLALELVPEILAAFLCQDVLNPLAFAEKRWGEIDRGFRLVDFSKVLSTHGVELFREILKLAPGKDVDDVREARILNVLSLIPLRQDQRDPDTGKLTEAFLYRLVNQFADVIRNLRGRAPYTVKLQCLKGLELFMRWCETDTSAVSNQIFTLLQSSLDLKPLELVAMQTWHTVIGRLGRKVTSVLDLTFAIISQKWSVFTPESKNVASNIVSELSLNSLVRAFVALRGSCSLPTANLQNVVESMEGKKLPLIRFSQIVQRASQENVFVSRQTMTELIQFLSTEQDIFYNASGDVRFYHDVGQVLKSLIVVGNKFNTPESTLVPSLAMKCLGLIGALDPARVDIRANNTAPVVVDNFEDGFESIKFVGYFVENFLLKELEASTDPNLQMFVAYGIQEYLKFCRLTPESLADGSAERWSEVFSPNAIDSLTPFLNTKYVYQAPLRSNEVYPIYNKEISYTSWLARFSYDMMCRTSGKNAETIFGLCRKITRGKEHFQSILKFIIPYACLNAVLGANDNREAFIAELRTVLNARSSADDDVSYFHKRIFSIIDYFVLWTRANRERKQVVLASVVENSLSQISADLMAMRSFECGSYPRAIRYWEQSLRDETVQNPLHIYENFRQMYARLGDTDNLEGISTKFPTMTVEQQILQHENTGNWNSAISCYNVLMDDLGKWDLSLTSDMLSCLNQAGRDEDVISRLRAIEASHPAAITSKMASFGVEAAWKKTSWVQLKHWIKVVPGQSEDLQVYLGRMFLAIVNRDHEGLVLNLHIARDLAAKKISKQDVTSLSQIRDLMVYLHGLADLESISSLIFYDNGDQIDGDILSDEMNGRLDRVGADYEAKSFLLSLRRAAFATFPAELSKNEMGVASLLMARQARKNGDWPRALQSVLDAKKLGSKDAPQEHAKLLWCQQDHREAIKMLESELDQHFVTGYSQKFSVTSLEYAKTALLYTDWLEISGQAYSDELILRYKAIQSMRPGWDKASYRLAKHLIKVYEAQLSLPPTHRPDSFYEGTIMTEIIRLLVNTLKNGVKYHSETLPKLITLWLDFGASCTSFETANHFTDPKQRDMVLRARLSNLRTVNSIITKSISKIPMYIFYAGLPQLLSRVGHQNEEVFSVMKSIIVTMGRLYPEQALWSLIEVASDSLNPTGATRLRNSRGRDILDALGNSRAKSKSKGDLAKLIQKSTLLVGSFRSLCYYQQEHMPRILKLDEAGFDVKSFPCDIAVPVQKLMNCILPHPGEEMRTHEAFPDHDATIFKIRRDVYVQHSLQKPKKVTIMGKDGIEYHLLCKGRDDVRKDSRLIEFTSAVNGLLSKNQDSSGRNLKIESYRVTPIDETAGIIEWVDNARPMKAIIEQNFATRGIHFNLGRAKHLLDHRLDPRVRLQNFEKLCKQFPSVLYDWFVDTFPDPVSWIRARTFYARSAAVMSMVGYILGLGDRHLENLLLLKDTGCVLHVDFDCLFEKGLTFAVPEVVPFRLTKNIVDAMGVQGYEGTFRKACEITLSLLRNNEDLLMTILEPFIYDPVIITHSSKRGVSSPQNALEKIRDKIRGIQNRDSTALSVDGQVEHLILEAASAENLSRMYIGWAPFL